MLQKIVLVFALASFAGFAADSEVSFSTPAQIGQLKLAPGLYKLKLIGSMAMFTNTASNKSFSAVTHTEKSGQKAVYTAVLGSTADGLQRVDSIVLAGTDLRLTFK